MTAGRKKNPRIAALQRLLREEGLDALLVSGLVNVRYLCGFVGTYGLLLVDTRGATFITDGRYAEAAEGCVQGARVLIRPLMKSDEFFRDLLRKGSYDLLGFEATLPYGEFETLRKWARQAKTKLRKAPPLVEHLRRVKDEEEIKAIAKAARVADRMMEAAWDALDPGTTERDVSRAIRHAADRLGAEGESFPDIVASGANASRPHHRPCERRLRRGDMVTVDLGAIVDGYCSDLTRTPALGRATKKFERIYEVCLRAQEAAVKACRAGMAASELDAVAREIIESAGYGKHYPHGLGHGVGLEIHEAPRLAKPSRDLLEAGNVVTIEPGIYLPGFGGVRIEDLLVVTGGAPRVLSRSPKALTILDA